VLRVKNEWRSKMTIKPGDRVKWTGKGEGLKGRVFEVISMEIEGEKVCVRCKLVTGESLSLSTGYVILPGSDGVFYTFNPDQLAIA